MSDQSKIEWTDATWNPIRGCSKVSEGCENCYAMHIAARFSGGGQPYDGLAKRRPANWTGKLRFVESALDRPLSWKKPRRIFVNSMSDLFHEHVSHEWINRVFRVIDDCPRHVFQILTKRAAEMKRYFESQCWEEFPIPENCWLGVSCENQRRTDERAAYLSTLIVPVAFVSCEPLLGPIDLRGHLPSLHWVIVGCESGASRRPMHLEWAKSIVDQCQAAGVACFVKQLPIAGKVSHNLDEWPEDLRVRQFPATEAVASSKWAKT